MVENKTIKQLAEEIGFSKAYIDKTIRSLNMHTKLNRVGNKYVINKSQEKLILKTLEDKKAKVNTHTNMHNESSYVSEVEFLRSQMENKDRELERMQKLLDQQQQLTLQSNKQIEQLQQQLMLLAPQEEEPEQKTKEEAVEKDSVTLEEMNQLKAEIAKLKEDEKKWWQFWK